MSTCAENRGIGACCTASACMDEPVSGALIGTACGGGVGALQLVVIPCKGQGVLAKSSVITRIESLGFCRQRHIFLSWLCPADQRDTVILGYALTVQNDNCTLCGSFLFARQGSMPCMLWPRVLATACWACLEVQSDCQV